MNFWGKHFSRLQDSLAAQIERIRAGSNHSTIKGTSIEVVIRRMLTDYLPGHFSVRSGQIANSAGDLSPQQDIIVYDGRSFPHLAVNEDSSVIVCCESVLAAVECKTYWKQEDIEKHLAASLAVESKRQREFAEKGMLAGYFVFFHETATPQLGAFEDSDRTIGFYCLEGDKSWSSPFGRDDFEHAQGSVLETFFKDVLRHCMRIGQVEIGDFSESYAVLSKYLGWEADENNADSL